MVMFLLIRLFLSLFVKTLNLEDYSPADLALIAKGFAKGTSLLHVKLPSHPIVDTVSLW